MTTQTNDEQKRSIDENAARGLYTALKALEQAVQLCSAYNMEHIDDQVSEDPDNMGLERHEAIYLAHSCLQVPKLASSFKETSEIVQKVINDPSYVFAGAE